MSYQHVTGSDQSGRKIICVDLDGTLVKSDMLFEGLCALLKRAPLQLLLAPFWLLQGRAVRGNHARSGREPLSACKPRRPKLFVPFDLPGFALNYYSVRAFNHFYYYRQRAKTVVQTVAYEPFFYPLDAVGAWNRIYGARGLLQFQCVIPKSKEHAPLRAILKLVIDSGRGSFLAVLKEFGDVGSPGMLSFPRPGVTLCLDFPFRGESTLGLMRRLDELVRGAGGALYPAKDACMPPRSFQEYYPRWKEFSAFIDPKFSSSFWRRVTGEKAPPKRGAA